MPGRRAARHSTARGSARSLPTPPALLDFARAFRVAALRRGCFPVHLARASPCPSLLFRPTSPRSSRAPSRQCSPAPLLSPSFAFILLSVTGGPPRWPSGKSAACVVLWPVCPSRAARVPRLAIAPWSWPAAMPVRSLSFRRRLGLRRFRRGRVLSGRRQSPMVAQWPRSRWSMWRSSACQGAASCSRSRAAVSTALV